MPDDDSCVVVQQQDQIEIYPNKSGGLTIRSVCYPSGEEMLISFLPEHAEKIVSAIRNAAHFLGECDGALQED